MSECDDRIRERLAVLEHALPLQVQVVKERMDMRADLADRALALQFAEYMRRLDDLNGEAGRLREMQASYVPREVFDRQVGPMQRFQDNLTGRMAMLAAVVSIVGAILGSFLTFWLKGGTS